MHREAVAELVDRVVRGGGGAGQFFVVEVQVAGGVAGEEEAARAWKPLQARHFCFVDQALEGEGGEEL